MAQTQTATGTTPPNGNGTSTNGTGKAPKTLTAIDAVSKISKILNQLTPPDRKRVLAFVNESNPGEA